MLKISQAGKAKHSVVLKLEGRVVGPWVGELRHVCEALLTGGQALRLDLADVTFADPDGVGVLSNLKSDGVRFVNCSPFVKEQLKSPTEVPKTSAEGGRSQLPAKTGSSHRRLQVFKCSL